MYRIGLIFLFLFSSIQAGTLQERNVSDVYEDPNHLMHINDGSFALYTGKVKRYYKNGQLRSEAFYKKGLLEGKMVAYHKNGYRSGTSRYWDEKGVKVMKTGYRDGAPVQ